MLSKKAFSRPKSFSEGKKPPLVVGNSSIKYFFCNQLSKLLYFRSTSLIVTSYLSVRINILNSKLISFLTCQYSCEYVPIWLSKILSQRQHIFFAIIYFQPILAIKNSISNNKLLFMRALSSQPPFSDHKAVRNTNIWLKKKINLSIIQLLSKKWLILPLIKQH